MLHSPPSYSEATKSRPKRLTPASFVWALGDKTGKGRKIQDAILQTQRRNPRVGSKIRVLSTRETLWPQLRLQLFGRQYVSTLDADLKMPQGELWRPLSFVVILLCSFIMLSFFLDVFLFSLSNFMSDMLSMSQRCTYLWSNGWIGG